MERPKNVLLEPHYLRTREDQDDGDECQLCEQEAELAPGTFTPHEHTEHFDRLRGGDRVRAAFDIARSTADADFDAQIERERRAGFRGAAVDPPFASLTARVEETLAQVTKPWHELQDEIGFLADVYSEWTQHVADYGFDRPERVAALSVFAAVEPEIRAWNTSLRRQPTEREIAEWLASNAVAVRILDRVCSYSTCAFYDVRRAPNLAKKRAAMERRFLRQVVEDIREELPWSEDRA